MLFISRSTVLEPSISHFNFCMLSNFVKKDEKILTLKNNFTGTKLATDLNFKQLLTYF